MPVPVSSVLGSITGSKPRKTFVKAHHLSTKRNVGTTRAIAKPTAVAPTLFGNQNLVRPTDTYNESQFSGGPKR
jgi:hypothetical protein